MEYVKLIAGLILLVVSGDYLVRGGVALAKSFKVSTLVIGVTIVSMGTSLPELFVSAQAVMDGSPEIAMGNVLGSNIANIALVLGLTAMVFPMAVKRTSAYFDTPFMVAVTLLLYAFLRDNAINTLEAIVFVVLLAAFVFWTFKKASMDKLDVVKSIDQPAYPIWLSVVIVLLCSAGLKFGAEWLVDGAEFIASQFNVSKTVISVTLVAFGTSVPELATSVIAALKKEPDISVGNIVGSNIFNILGVLGVTSLIKNIDVSADPTIKSFHMNWVLMIAIALLVLLLPFLKLKVHRYKGALFFAFYIAYIWLMIKNHTV
jgi:cation:H+ antiporter